MHVLSLSQYLYISPSSLSHQVWQKVWRQDVSVTCRSNLPRQMGHSTSTSLPLPLPPRPPSPRAAAPPAPTTLPPLLSSPSPEPNPISSSPQFVCPPPSASQPLLPCNPSVPRAAMRPSSSFQAETVARIAVDVAPRLDLLPSRDVAGARAALRSALADSAAGEGGGANGSERKNTGWAMHSNPLGTSVCRRREVDESASASAVKKGVSAVLSALVPLSSEERPCHGDGSGRSCGPYSRTGISRKGN